jgi:hypothetical protein
MAVKIFDVSKIGTGINNASGSMNRGNGQSISLLRPAEIPNIPMSKSAFYRFGCKIILIFAKYKGFNMQLTSFSRLLTNPG